MSSDILFENDNFRIKKKEQLFHIQSRGKDANGKLLPGDEESHWIDRGFYNFINKFKIHKYDYNGNKEIEQIIEIDSPSYNKTFRTNNLEIDITKNRFIDVADHIRIEAINLNINNVWIPFYQYLQSENIKFKEIIKSPIYGIINKDLVLLPSEAELIDESNKLELKCLKKVLNKKVKRDKEIEQEVFKRLHRYLSKDPLNLFIFCNTFTNFYRFYCMDEGLTIIPYLFIYGSSTNGKTSRFKLLNNLLFMGYNDVLGSDMLYGTERKEGVFQYVTIPLYVDDLSTFGNTKKEIEKRKNAATSKTGEYSRGRQDGKTVDDFLIPRTLCFTTNKLDNVDSVLLKSRCYGFNINDYSNNSYPALDDDYSFITENFIYITKWIWNKDNIKNILDIIKVQYKGNRLNQYQTGEPIRIGLDICNYMFKEYGLEALELDIQKHIKDPSQFVVNDDDIVSQKIYDYIIWVTSDIKNDNRNLFDYPNIINDEAACNKLDRKCSEKGLHVYCNKEKSFEFQGKWIAGFLITSDFISLLKKRYATDPTIKNFKTPRDLIPHFKEKTLMVAQGDRNAWKQSLSVSKGVKKGLFVKFNVSDKKIREMKELPSNDFDSSNELEKDIEDY